MSRRKGRILAVQALYSYDMGKEPLEELLKLEWIHDEKESENAESDSEGEKSFITGETSASSEPASDSEDFARILISGTINHLDEIDDLIKKHLSEKWDFSRINRVSLAIMRVSVFSLLYQKDLHHSIVIDEAIAIAKDYGEDDSFKFINAVLDNVRKEIAS